MKPVRFIIIFLLLLAGCGNESVNEAKPSPGGVSYSSSPEKDPSVESSGSPEPVASSSSEVVIEESSSGLQLSSLAVESSSFSLITSSSEDAEWSSSSMSQGCTGPACYLYSSSSSSSSSIKVVYGEMTDERDGQVYKTVYVESIDRTWMIQNLNYAYLQPTAELDSSSWCQNDDPENCGKNGRLYIWSAAMDSAGLFSEDGKGCGYGVICDYPEPDTANFFWYWIVRGVCPAGWHLPNSDEWSEFIFAALGGYRSTILAKRSNEVDLFDSVQLDLSPLFFDLNSRTVEYWESEGPWKEYANSVVFTTIDGSVYEGSKPRFTKNRVRCIQDYERGNW